MKGTVTHLQPEGLHRNPAYSQVVIVEGSVRTVYIGGQNAIDATGAIIGKGDLQKQTDQVFRNLIKALAAAGAHLEHVIKWNILVVAGQSIHPAFEVFQRVWGNRPHPPLISVAFVVGLAHPDFLVELEAIAAVPG